MHTDVHLLRSSLREQADKLDHTEIFVAKFFEPTDTATQIVNLLTDARVLLNQAEIQALKLQPIKEKN